MTAQSSTGSEPASSNTDFGANEWLVEEMYERYLADPNGVDAAWHDFFTDYRPAGVATDQTSATNGAAASDGVAAHSGSPNGTAAAETTAAVDTTAANGSAGATSAAAAASSSSSAEPTVTPASEPVSLFSLCSPPSRDLTVSAAVPTKPR